MPVGDLWRDLYEAETLSDASRAVLSSAPRWAPWVGAGAFFISYVGFIRVKIFIGKWRRAARKRAERKFLTISQWQSWETTPAYAELSLTGEGDGGGDGDDDSDVEERCGNGCEDRTMLTLDDIDEFRKSLRLRLPRDNDLLVSIEEMLLVDEIPDGWVLYRTTAGVVRFMNLNTQELAYFPPGQREKEYHIRKELRRRSRLEAARKCTLLCGGDVNSVGHFGVSQAYPADQLLNGSNGDRALSTSRSSGEGQEDRDSQGDAQRHNESASCEDSWSSSSDDDYLCDQDEQSTFQRVFHYFLQCERKRKGRELDMPCWGRKTGDNVIVRTEGNADAKVDAFGRRLVSPKRLSGRGARDMVGAVSGDD